LPLKKGEADRSASPFSQVSLNLILARSSISQTKSPILSLVFEKQFF
jgi:hypothetical protein